MTKNNFFLIIEGIDGAGKSTVAKYIYKELSSKIKINITAEPTSGDVGKLVEDISYERNNNGMLLTLLYTADRIIHSKDINDLIERGESVICDRYMYSTVAYQAVQLYDMKIFDRTDNALQWLLNLQKMSVSYIPDIKIYIDITPEIAISRISSKSKIHPFEKKQFLDRVRNNYLSIMDIEKNWIVVNGSEPYDKTGNYIINTLKNKNFIT
ncbi:MAG: dTMP kinase [Candidatus Thermoplasmatota archaeon]|jgi:dTMP kinase|nr:dTMP kinase [Candidatus Thermoplasmatota archaeon]MCL5963363.1 dTMP kinase [Candidatus Thermoplasmatota archaeon]